MEGMGEPFLPRSSSSEHRFGGDAQQFDGDAAQQHRADLVRLARVLPGLQAIPDALGAADQETASTSASGTAAMASARRPPRKRSWIFTAAAS